jgi:hypothetical protein
MISICEKFNLSPEALRKTLIRSATQTPQQKAKYNKMMIQKRINSAEFLRKKLSR